jgi:transaldolase
MNANASLHDLGQSLWLDNLARDILNDGTLKHYIDDLSVTGITSNPTIFYNAIKNSTAYDSAILEATPKGMAGEDLFFSLAISDIQRAADLLLETHTRTNGVDGWVSLEVPPSLAHDAEGTVAAAKFLSRRVNRSNVFIKIPGTPQGLLAIEETVYSGIPINITLLFSPEQYSEAADAYLKGIERRIANGIPPAVPSVASVFISRWDVAIKDRVPKELQNTLGVAIAEQVYGQYRQLLSSARWQRAFNFGGAAQRLLWASTGTKDPNAPPTLYVHSLAAPLTINTMPDATLKALAETESVFRRMTTLASSSEATLNGFAKYGVDAKVLGAELQDAGVMSFQKSWDKLMEILDSKNAELSGSRLKVNGDARSGSDK